MARNPAAQPTMDGNDELYDVIIAGAGPIGLFLACELRLGGASVLVLERDATAESPWKEKPLGLRGLNTRRPSRSTGAGCWTRCWAPRRRRWTEVGKAVGPRFGGHFAGILLDAGKLEPGRWKYRLAGPGQTPGGTTIARVEAALAERAERLGATILRGHAVAGIAGQDAASVTATVETATGGRHFRGRWLVGCDGGRSRVRRVAGFGFEGTEATFTGYAVQCDLEPADALAPGFHAGGSGMYIVGFPGALYLIDFDGAAFDRAGDITREHVQAVLGRVAPGVAVAVGAVHHASSFTDRAKQASRYRRGRVLLAGDAAHIHSPLGAQGLNLGLGDAANLGWKLPPWCATSAPAASSAAPRRRSPRPCSTRTRPSAAPSPPPCSTGRAPRCRRCGPTPSAPPIRALVRDLIDTPDGTNLLIDRVWGLSQRYSLGGADDAHPLVGCSAPDFELDDGDRLGPKLAAGHGLLVDFGPDPRLRDLVAAAAYQPTVDYLATGARDKRGLAALLVRPDGVVAWVAEDGASPDVDAAAAALQRWFAL